MEMYQRGRPRLNPFTICRVTVPSAEASGSRVLLVAAGEQEGSRLVFQHLPAEAATRLVGILKPPDRIAPVTIALRTRLRSGEDWARPLLLACCNQVKRQWGENCSGASKTSKYRRGAIDITLTMKPQSIAHNRSNRAKRA